ncbi:MAG: leucine--tRNA ligase [Planctomycetota bacterium]|nr:leucine--tRNA ligase [Planctomycetota bacterium]
MAGYDFAAIETKWQAYWQQHETFRQPNPGDADFVERPKFYVLDMFPYPSGAGLHVGHPSGYTATDIVARYRRMRGCNVLHPMGYDAFGLPAEQYAVEHGVHPRQTTAKNVANIERQIKKFGFSYDWSRRLATTDVNYYRWTQWIFLKMYNSWYDPAADAARPISELIGRLESGEYLIGIGGDIVFEPPSATIEALAGMPAGYTKFTELDGQQQRRLIDEYRLAYQAEVPVNWCPKLGTVLANEEVTNEGKSERGDYPVYRRAMRQWMLCITAYAERLLADLERLDWPEPIKIMQRNWIGKSTGAEVLFRVKNSEETIEVYTTRPDTLFGATYMVLAPEHPLVEQITTDEQRDAVRAYVEEALKKTELERVAETREKTGVFTGALAINPVNEEKIPIWVADYVMMGYGTGAIMAVPAHDTRDLEFARQFNLPIVQVVQPPEGIDWQGYVDDGVAVNSGSYDGLSTAEFKTKITEWLEEQGLGKAAVNYKLRDWLFSRQRYWGEPFPIVHCERCGMVALPEDALPLELPEMVDFTPAASDDPEAPPSPPLGKLTDWVAATCPNCSGPANRELNTMPQWAGSCWYYLRFLDPKNDEQFCSPDIERYWMGPARSLPVAASKKSEIGGVDLYVGGAEHAVLHLLYSRFWHKVLYDLGCVSSPEPFGKLFNQGMIRSFAYRDGRGVCVGYEDVDLTGDKPRHKATGEELAESVEKMSKSLKNVVNPDDVIAQYGADTFRLYEMFMGPLEASKPWNTRDVPGVHRFLHRVWRMLFGGGDDDNRPLLADGEDDADIERVLHRLIKKAGEDIEAMKFNTAIAVMMEFVNAVYKTGRISQGQAERFTLVLAPFAPHLAEELWQRLGHDESLAYKPWPGFDEKMIVEEVVELAVQVNGKVRGRISVAADSAEDEVLAAALTEPKVASAVEGKTIVKKVVVPQRLVNLVVK